MTEKFYDIKMKRDGILDAGIMAVIVTFLRVPVSQDEVTAYLSDINDVYAKRKRFLIEYDATRIQKKPSTAMLQRLADDMKEKEAATQTYVVACAVVIDTSNVFGSVLHKLVKSILFIRKPVCPLNFFGSVEQAQAYLAQFNPQTSS